MYVCPCDGVKLGSDDAALRRLVSDVTAESYRIAEIYRLATETCAEEHLLHTILFPTTLATDGAI
jgi:hypothetical protein